jgi:uncharacterized DUF497 family protein
MAFPELWVICSYYVLFFPRKSQCAGWKSAILNYVHNSVLLAMDTGFEWDEDKRQANIAERGVDFRYAALIFQGPVLEAEDKHEDYGERRFRALGQVQGETYMVAFAKETAALSARGR